MRYLYFCLTVVIGLFWYMCKWGENEPAGSPFCYEILPKKSHTKVVFLTCQNQPCKPALIKTHEYTAKDASFQPYPPPAYQL